MEKTENFDSMQTLELQFYYNKEDYYITMKDMVIDTLSSIGAGLFFAFNVLVLIPAIFIGDDPMFPLGIVTFEILIITVCLLFIKKKGDSLDKNSGRYRCVFNANEMIYKFPKAEITNVYSNFIEVKEKNTYFMFLNSSKLCFYIPKRAIVNDEDYIFINKCIKKTKKKKVTRTKPIYFFIGFAILLSVFIGLILSIKGLNI